MNTQSKRNRKQRGVALIWVAIVSTLMLALAGLLIDFAWIFVTTHKLHNAADAAALAGARNVAVVMDPTLGDAPEIVADTYALKHTAANVTVDLVEAVSGLEDGTEISSVQSGAGITHPYDLTDDIVIGRYIDHSQLFVVDRVTPDSMLVVARREGGDNQPRVPLFFGPIFKNIDTIAVKRYAIAKVIAPYGAGVIALSECDCPGLLFDGVGTDTPLTIFNGGSLQVNSFLEGDKSGAVDLGSKNIILDIERLVSVGGLNDKFYDSMDSYPEAYEDADIQSDLGEDYVEPDPYAAPILPDHDLAAIRALEDKGAISDTGTYSPGYYSGGLQVNGGAITLEPGDYYLDSVGENASLSVNSGSIKDDSGLGKGVTLHIIGDADLGANITGGDIDISSPTTGVYAGIGIYQKRDYDYDCEQSCIEPWEQSFPRSEFNGNGELNIDGAVYMPDNKLELGGTGGIYITRLVADRILISGTGEKIINYKGEPEIVGKSYLVE